MTLTFLTCNSEISPLGLWVKSLTATKKWGVGVLYKALKNHLECLMERTLNKL